MSLADMNLGPHPGEQVFLSSILNLSATAILYYDYLITLSREIQFLWPPHNKLGWFTVACFLNRYLPVFAYLPIVVSYFVPWTLQFCLGIHEFNLFVLVVLQMLSGTLCLIRVYALYGRSPRLLGVLMMIGLGAAINASVMLIASYRLRESTLPVISSVYGCNQFTPYLGGRYGALAWIGMPIFDGVIFFLTLYKAFTLGKGVRLLDMIVRDGTMYFSILSIMNLANILTLRYAPPLLRSSTATWTNVLSTTLVSRLVFNLREQNAALAGLPITVETQRHFQAALPVAGAIASVRFTRTASVPLDRSTS